jgi:hypothetical protein
MAAVTKKEKTRIVAIQGTKKDGSEHIVGIGNLRVMITNDDGSWFAQGMEIDFAAEGATLEEAKANFEHGLCESINEHLNIYGTIEKLLVPAPKDAWVDLINAAAMKKLYSQLTLHKTDLHKTLPFESIQYFSGAPAHDNHASGQHSSPNCN